MDPILALKQDLTPPPLTLPVDADMAKLSAEAGSNLWKDQRIPAQDRMDHFLKVNAMAGRDRNSVAQDAAKLFGMSKDDVIAKLPTARTEAVLGAYRQQFKSMDREPLTHYIASRSVPFGSAIGRYLENRDYAERLDRYKQGQATDEDLNFIAGYERLNELKAQDESTFGGGVKSAMFSLPAIIGEAAATRGLAVPFRAAAGANAAVQAAKGTAGLAARTAAMPSMGYVDKAQQNAQQYGGNTGDFRNLAPAFAYGMAQNAILGQMQKNIGGSFAGQTAKKTIVAMGEQQIVDTASSGINDAAKLAGYDLHLDTGYGTLGKLVQDFREGKQEGLNHLAVEAVTFGVFSAMHSQPSRVPQAFAGTIKALRGKGLSEAKAAEALRPVMDAAQFGEDGSLPDPNAIRKAGEAAKDPAIKDFADSLAESLPVDAWANENTLGSRNLPEGVTLPQPEPTKAPEVSKPVVNPEPAPPVESPKSVSEPKAEDMTPAQWVDYLTERRNKSEESIKAAEAKLKGIQDQVTIHSADESSQQYQSAIRAEKIAQKQLKAAKKQYKDTIRELEDARSKKMLAEAEAIRANADQPFEEPAAPAAKQPAPEPVVPPPADNGAGPVGPRKPVKIGRKGATKKPTATPKPPKPEDVRAASESHLATTQKQLEVDVNETIKEIVAETGIPRAEAEARVSEALQQGIRDGEAAGENEGSRLSDERLIADTTGGLGAERGKPTPAERPDGAGQSSPDRGGSRSGSAGRVGKQTEIVLVDSGERIPAKYELRELGEVKASEMATDGYRFTSRVKDGDPDYPADLQPRDYSSVSEHEKLLNGVKNFDPRYLVTDFADATSGPPTISRKGNIAINGNGRQVMLEMLDKRGRYADYKDYLREHAKEFGIDPAQVDRMQKPALYRVVDIDPTSAEARKFAQAGNRSATQEQPGIQLADQLNTLVTGDLVRSLRINGEATFSSMISEAAGKPFREALYEKLPVGVRPRYIKDNLQLTDEGKILVKRMLVLKVVPADVYGRLEEDKARFVDTIESAVPVLMTLQRTHPGRNPMPDLQEAIRILARHPDIKQGDIAGANKLFQQLDMFGDPGAVQETATPSQRMLLDFVVKNMYSPREFNRGLRELVNLTRHSNSLFGGDVAKNEPISKIASKNLGVQERPGANFGFDKDAPTLADESAAMVDNMPESAAPAEYEKPGEQSLSRQERRPWSDTSSLPKLVFRDIVPSADPMIDGPEKAYQSIRQMYDERTPGFWKSHISREEGGGIDLGQAGPNQQNLTRAQVAAFAAQQTDGISRAGRWIADEWHRLGGRIAPAVRRYSEAASDAIARFISVGHYTRLQAPEMIEKVMGKGATEDDRIILGGLLTEMRLRHMRRAYADESLKHAQAYQALVQQYGPNPIDKAVRKAMQHHRAMQDKMLERAKNVRTIVDRPGQPAATGAQLNPFTSEGVYRQYLADPRYQQMIANFKQHMVPHMESTFRQYKGMNPTDPINSLTQIPDMPVNLMVGDPTVPGVVMTGGTKAPRRGKLTNQKLLTNKFTLEAKGDASAYVIDAGLMIENALTRANRVAAHATMYRELIKAGVAYMGTAGDVRQTPEGQDYKRIERADPPKNTKLGQVGESELFVRPEIYDEVRRALSVDAPVKYEPIRRFNNIVTQMALASTAEFTYHTRNLLTMMLKPGMNLGQLIHNAHEVIRNSPEARDRLVELARIGALKEKGLESGNIPFPESWTTARKLDPTKHLGKILDFFDKTLRLTADDAFNNLAKRKYLKTDIQMTEANRRDFINQLGQYNRAGQSGIIALIRDLGLGPFATAGSNYFVQGVRGLTGNAGVRSTTTSGAIALRAEMYARAATVLSTALLYNFFKWGNIWGDDDTPLGAIKIADKDNKIQYWDLAGLTGLSRGARATGLMAVAEGLRHGKGRGEIQDHAFHDATHSALHPAMGPTVSFAYTATTGKNTLGNLVAEQKSKATTPQGEARAVAKGRPPSDSSQSYYDIKAAIANMNPSIAALTGQDRLYRHGEEPDTWDRIIKLAGPYGLKERHKESEKKRR